MKANSLSFIFLSATPVISGLGLVLAQAYEKTFISFSTNLLLILILLTQLKFTSRRIFSINAVLIWLLGISAYFTLFKEYPGSVVRVSNIAAIIMMAMLVSFICEDKSFKVEKLIYISCVLIVLVSLSYWLSLYGWAPLKWKVFPLWSSSLFFLTAVTVCCIMFFVQGRIIWYIASLLLLIVFSKRGLILFALLVPFLSLLNLSLLKKLVFTFFFGGPLISLLIRYVEAWIANVNLQIGTSELSRTSYRSDLLDLFFATDWNVSAIIFGSGPGASYDLIKYAGFPSYVTSFHNAHVEVLFSYGVVGYVIFMSYFFLRFSKLTDRSLIMFSLLFVWVFLFESVVTDLSLVMFIFLLTLGFGVGRKQITPG